MPTSAIAPLGSGEAYAEFFRQVEALGLDAVWTADRIFHAWAPGSPSSCLACRRWTFLTSGAWPRTWRPWYERRRLHDGPEGFAGERLAFAPAALDTCRHGQDDDAANS